MVPAATLPADPLQVSYEAGEPTIDPRDMLNPILHKPYHGEALKTDWMRSANYSALDEVSETDQAGAYAIYHSQFLHISLLEQMLYLRGNQLIS